MATDIVMNPDQADGPRGQAWKALSLHPSTTTTLATALGTEARACIGAAIAKIEHDLRPVPQDAIGRDGWCKAIDERLRRLAVKVLPTAKPADTEAWRSALVEALADLPAMVALTAAKRAIHRPFRFIGDIEVTVREIAAEVLADRQERLAAFTRHRDEIDRALNPPTAALPAPNQDAPISAQSIRAMSLDIRRMGLRAGFITQDQVDAAFADFQQAEAA
jgi:hypothetical protein